MVGVTVDQAAFDDLAAHGRARRHRRTQPAQTSPHLVTNAALSISQGGYNTVMEVLEAEYKRAVIVPYAGRRRNRADLARRRNSRAARPSRWWPRRRYAPQTLAAAVDAAWRRDPPEERHARYRRGRASAADADRRLGQHAVERS